MVLGLGRLGGGALTHASDLDIVYLFTGDFAAQSDGPRPLGGNGLLQSPRQSGQRSAFSADCARCALRDRHTAAGGGGGGGGGAAGQSGAAGSQLRSFRQIPARGGVDVGSTLALARARVLYGSAQARRELGAVLDEVLHAPRDKAELLDAVLAMRAEMARHKQPGGPLDAKLLRGGLVDIEFLVHYLQLKGENAAGAQLGENVPRALDPDLAVALEGLVEAGLLPADITTP